MRLTSPASPWRAMLLLPLVAVSCYFGPSIDSYAPATSPAGAEVTVRARKWKLSGELIAVDDSSLVVLGDSRLVRVPWTAARSIAVRHVGDIQGNGRPPRRETAERLRLVSRFPQGLTPAIERALLGVMGRDSIEVRP